MSGEDPLTYSVIITISLPGDAGETSLRLVLGPADPVPAPDGSTRLLQDCTLAELQQFADALEADLWRDYLDATLVDLVVDDDLQIDFTFDDGDPDASPTARLLLDHAVVFPEGPVLEGNESPDQIDPAAGEVQPDIGEPEGFDIDELDAPTELEPDLEPSTERVDADVVDTDADDAGAIVEETGEAAQEPSPAAELESPPVVESVEAGEPATEEEPLVTVAEPEPVHEEREATAEPIAPPVLPRVRILGRRRPLGHSTPSAVDILINETAFRDAQAHAISSPEREVAGVLVGPQPEKQPDGRYVVHITDMIIAKHTRMQGASVTYTPESWRYVNDRLAERYPDDTAVIVGWYHTHPGFGIFLSGMDRFIHHNFFTQIWHVALVLDPHARKSGFFSWNRPMTQVDAYEFPWPNWAAGSW